MSAHDLVIFDLDGTLADTLDDLTESVGYAVERDGRARPPRDVVRGAVGAGVRMLIERLTPRADAATRDRVLADFLAHYGEHLLDRTKLYPGVEETLSRLPSRLAVATNKPEAFSRRLLEGLGIARRFQAIVGGDTLPVRKPDPQIVTSIVDRVGGARPVVVGDSGTDRAMAKAAGCAFIAVTYGYCLPGELDTVERRVDRFADLVEMLK